MPEQRESDGLSLHAAIALVRRRLGIVLFVVLAVPALAYGFSKLQDREYTASASLLFRDPGLDQQLAGTDYVAPATDPTRVAATNAKLVSLDTVAARTARALGGSITDDEVADAIEVKAEGQADVVSIDATDERPRFAARLANTFAEQYIAFRREADRSKIREAQDLVRRRLARLTREGVETDQAAALRERADQLDIIASLQTGNAELVQRAEEPTSPSAPKTRRNVIIAAIFGLLLAAGIAVLLDKLDRRIRDPKEVEEMFGRPVLGLVPHSRTLERRGPARAEQLPAREAEVFWMLRANLLYFNVDEPIRTVLVTSPASGDGKSTVSWNLATAAASTGSAVLIIEADLRNPVMRRAGSARQGLSNVLSGQASFQDAVVSVPVPDDDSPHTMDVMTAGPQPPNPVDLLESERMSQLIEEAGRDYDLVILDTPPTAVVSDAIPLTKQVDGVIVVCRLGRSTRDGLAHLHTQLEHLRAPILGVVVNDVQRVIGRYGYGLDQRYAYATAGGSDNGVGEGRGSRRIGRRDKGVKP